MIVIGGGGSGLAAAVAAAERGASVLLLETIEGINPYATGDGHRLAQQAGAKLVNMSITYGPELRFIPPPRKPFTQLLPGSGPVARIMGQMLPLVPRMIINALVKRLLVTWQHPENALFDDGAVLVNAHGERFCNEVAYPDREIAIAGQPDKSAYILLDRRLTERYAKWPHFISTAPEVAYAYVADYLRMRPDVAVCAESLERLAQRRRLPPQSLRAAVEAFNCYARGEAADPWGRIGDGQPVGGDRWVLLGPVKAFFTTTEGGRPSTNNSRFSMTPAKRSPASMRPARTAWAALSFGATACTSLGP